LGTLLSHRPYGFWFIPSFVSLFPDSIKLTAEGAQESFTTEKEAGEA